MALSRDRSRRGFFHGTSACLSALYRAERYAEITDILAVDTIWSYQRWAVKALAAMGKKSEAIRYAEALRSPWASDREVDSLCEEILLSSGLVDEAYERYALTANQAGTYLAWFRAVAKKYPHKAAAEVLDDLVKTTPGEEGKWYAAAKEAGLYDQAVELAKRTPCDPRTLTRAAGDFARKNPVFAVEAGLAALHWLVLGYGYEISGADVRAAYENTMEAAEHAGRREEVRTRVRDLVASETFGERFVTKILGRELGIS
jgi:hypothetical protein